MRYAKKTTRTCGCGCGHGCAAARCSGPKLFAVVVAIDKNRSHCDRERIRQVGTVDG